MTKLALEFYLQPDVVAISRDLLGKLLMTRIDGIETGGIITETEAYAGPEDRASHAYGNRRTERTEVMFQSGGLAYIYLCYGIHHLFNVVTNVEGIPHAVLVRAIHPIVGVSKILARRNKDKFSNRLCSGPGTLSQGLGLRTRFSGMSLLSDTIWIEETGISITDDQIITGKRVGVEYAGVDAHRLWRFRVKTLKIPLPKGVQGDVRILV